MAQSLFLSHATLGTSRGCTHRRQALAEPRQAIPEAVVDISEAARAMFARRMRIAPVLGLAISDEDSGSEEEAIPINK